MIVDDHLDAFISNRRIAGGAHNREAKLAPMILNSRRAPSFPALNER
ncbi:MAG TPA: hypothetical protein VLI21_07395 [Casimicrobiaceae bacterium]|nr:hypothetical protein [Casimicrobiaceae bacterium]